ncbi:hypothetical protein TNCV_4940071 [Trichonephila clavipes]|nr:hypothetical protein TNCV_4940071 [Trichonephila clavipes]
MQHLKEACKPCEIYIMKYAKHRCTSRMTVVPPDLKYGYCSTDRGRSYPPQFTATRDDRWIVCIAEMGHAATSRTHSQ